MLKNVILALCFWLGFMSISYAQSNALMPVVPGVNSAPAPGKKELGLPPTVQLPPRPKDPGQVSPPSAYGKLMMEHGEQNMIEGK
jgi:hypothetical protein